jgi:protein gp37
VGVKTGIAWCDATFNPWEGCVNVSAECDNCYAQDRDRRYHAAENWGKDALRLMHTKSYWTQLRKWNRDADLAGERRRVFEGSLCDVMEDRPDLAGPRQRLFEEIEATPFLDHLMLTKRPQNFRKFLPQSWMDSPRRNVWLGTTAGVEKSLWRVDELVSTPAAIRFLSVEPMLEAMPSLGSHLKGISWLIIGGESGPGARPFDIEWARQTIEQCRIAGTACFVKQLGAVALQREYSPQKDGRDVFGPDHEWPLGTFFGNRTGDPKLNGRQVLLKDRKGGDISEFPIELRIREFPQVGA